VLGGTIENELYSSLPLSMNGGPRDPTAFQYLMPGVQENPGNNTNQGTTAGSSGIYGGTGQTNLNQNYVEGVPVSNIMDLAGQRHCRRQCGFGGCGQPVLRADQRRVHIVRRRRKSPTTPSTPAATSSTAPSSTSSATPISIPGATSPRWPIPAGYGEKPGEHQNSYGGSMGGPILKDKLFFFGSYEGYRYTKISNTPSYITIPTMDNRRATSPIWARQPRAASPTPHTRLIRLASRLPGTAERGADLQRRSPFSVLPHLATLQSALPAAHQPLDLPITILPSFPCPIRTTPSMSRSTTRSTRAITSPSPDWAALSGTAAHPTTASYSQLPRPYAAGTYTNSEDNATGIFTYIYVASNSLINTLSYGYTRNWGESFSLTKGTPYTATAAGITNLPPGNASDNMPP
jgi:hypothetical protein